MIVPAVAVAVAVAALTFGGTTDAAVAGTEVPPAACEQTVEVLDTIDIADPVFTQGLVFVDDRLYESGGLYGESELREVDPATWDVLRSVELPGEVFAEGLTELDSKLYQLTWQEGLGFVWDVDSLAPLGRFALTGEGWGLTTDGSSLVMSDGSSELRWLDPRDFSEIRRVTVTDGGVPVVALNELEYVDGLVLANVWQTDQVAVIDADSGAVLAWIDLADLAPPVGDPGNDVLNGIAVIPDESGELLITGKRWPVAYRIELGPECWIAPQGSTAPTAPA